MHRKYVDRSVLNPVKFYPELVSTQGKKTPEQNHQRMTVLPGIVQPGLSAGYLGRLPRATRSIGCVHFFRNSAPFTSRRGCIGVVYRVPSEAAKGGGERVAVRGVASCQDLGCRVATLRCAPMRAVNGCARERSGEEEEEEWSHGRAGRKVGQRRR